MQLPLWLQRRLPFAGFIAVALLFGGAIATGSYLEVVGKIYAIIGTIFAAVPFFKETPLRDAIENLEVGVANPVDADVIRKAWLTLKGALDLERRNFVWWMRAALVFAIAAFVIDAWVAHGNIANSKK